MHKRAGNGGRTSAGLQEKGERAPPAPALPYAILFVLFTGVMAILLATATFGLGGLLIAATLVTTIARAAYRRRRKRSAPTVSRRMRWL